MDWLLKRRSICGGECGARRKLPRAETLWCGCGWMYSCSYITLLHVSYYAHHYDGAITLYLILKSTWEVSKTFNTASRRTGGTRWKLMLHWRNICQDRKTSTRTYIRTETEYRNFSSIHIQDWKVPFSLLYWLVRFSSHHHFTDLITLSSLFHATFCLHSSGVERGGCRKVVGTVQ